MTPPTGRLLQRGHELGGRVRAARLVQVGQQRVVAGLDPDRDAPQAELAELAPVGRRLAFAAEHVDEARQRPAGEGVAGRREDRPQARVGQHEGVAVGQEDAAAGVGVAAQQVADGRDVGGEGGGGRTSKARSW
jgi:hypothetical protein